MICPHCNKNIPDGTAFCPACGSALQPQPQPQYQAQQQPQQQQAYNYAMPVQPAKKKGHGCLVAIIIAIAVIFLFILLLAFMPASDDAETVDEPMASVQHEAQTVDVQGVRDHYTQIKGDGTDTVTVMMYVIGSDLESDGGAATSDLVEITNATIGDNVNYVVQTGGCTEWQNNIVEGNKCQRFLAKDGGLEELMDLGAVNMATPESVTDFITYASQEYPADRYEFIFWDHGGGTLCGYGSDELYPDYTITLPQIAQAFKSSNVKFDFVGFDACLMGTVETAYALEPYADYLIASEETEPGTGWYYTNWITDLSNNTSMPTVDIAKQIINDFVDGPDSTGSGDTLSITELREIPNVYQNLCAYMSESKKMLEDHDFSQISSARANTRAFGTDEYDQIDILHYLSLADIESEDLQNAIKSAVKYSSATVKNANGLAMYYPYNSIDYYQYVYSEMQEYGYAGVPTDYYNTFLSILVGGKTKANAPVKNAMPESAPQDNTDYATQSWYDASAQDTYSEDYGTDEDYEEKEIIEKDGYYALHLTDDEWNTITDVQQQVIIIDTSDNQYVDLGSDNSFDFDEDGDLKVEFEYVWLSINDNIVPFYFESEDDDQINGYIPAMLNGNTEIELIARWDAQHDDGYVAGYRLVTDEITTAAKGLAQLKQGDVVEVLFDCYDMNTGEYSQKVRTPAINVGTDELVVTYSGVDDYDADVCFMLTDVYNNTFWTQSVSYTDE